MKIYIVVETYREWEYTYDQIAGVCSSLELANKLVNKIKQAHTWPKTISLEKYKELYNEACKFAGIFLKTIPATILELFPEYSKEDIYLADTIYNEDWIDVKIKEKDLFESESELVYNKWN